tara:strand:+ start:41 stop:754 length:714 start_codon:yes stop_codon:yes gene_type:complete
MVLSRGLIISLGVSALGCTLLFLYFRNKITTMEKKVDVMFDLIQNHQQEQYNMQETMAFNNVSDNKTQENIGVETQGAWATEDNTAEKNLIEVSQDDASDSEEVSDSDEEDMSDDENLPKISLDKENMTLEVNDIKKITVQETDKVKIDDSIQLEEVEDITDSLDEIDEDTDDEDNTAEETEETDKTKEITVEKLDDEFDYNKLKVAELKTLAKQKGLQNYKSLKKGPLVELLKSSE